MIKNSICTLAFLLMFCVGQCSKGTVGKNDISFYLPVANELKDWKPVGQMQKFEGEDLFLFINGGAEIYYEYGFARVITQEYRNKKDKVLNLEVYEMKDSTGAYGMYTFKTGDTGQRIAIGNDGFLEEYYLNLWSGNLLVTVTGFDSEEETVNGLMTIAQATCARIKDRGQKPLLTNVLPKKNLRVNSIKYLKGNLGLFNHYEFDSENIFGLREGVIGDYGNFEAFVFRYDDKGESMEWYENARDHFENNPRFHNYTNLDSAFTMIDGEEKPIHVEPFLNYIIIISGRKHMAADILLEEVKARIRQTRSFE